MAYGLHIFASFCNLNEDMGLSKNRNLIWLVNVDDMISPNEMVGYKMLQTHNTFG